MKFYLRSINSTTDTTIPGPPRLLIRFKILVFIEAVPDPYLVKPPAAKLSLKKSLWIKRLEIFKSGLVWFTSADLSTQYLLIMAIPSNA